MTKYVEELIRIIRSNLSKEELADRLSDYHDNDIAESLESLTEQERKKLYAALGMERMAEIFAYVDDAEPYLKELSYPLNFIMAMPGKNWPDRLTKMRGMAKLSVEFQVHSGPINCGMAN